MKLSKPRVVAVATSDVHLSLVPPLARAEEKDWLKAQLRPWTEIEALAEQHRCPILVAGDLFDRWHPPIELVNWALDNLPNMYCIPGNHDLPGHNPRLQHRSAYGALVRAGKIKHVGLRPTTVNEITLYGSRLDGKYPRRVHDNGLSTHILLTHEYLWTGEHRYTGAPGEQRLDKVAQKFYGWDLVLVGDNHLGFTRKLKGGTTLCNLGTPIRRKSDEARYHPSVALVHLSGEVHRHYLDISKDIITEIDPGQSEEAVQTDDPDLSNFIHELTRLDEKKLDFRSALKRATSKTTKQVRDLLLEALGD